MKKIFANRQYKTIPPPTENPNPGFISLFYDSTNNDIPTLLKSDGTKIPLALSNESQLLNGTSDPTTEGSDGDFYINTNTNYFFGPKASGSWPTGFSLVGSDGVDGKTILNGSVDPTTEGVDGDFYINTASNTIFGPKASGSWPTGVSLVGPAGANGADGVDGADGSDGFLDYTETTMTSDLTVNSNHTYVITSSDSSVTITLGPLIANVTNYYTVTFTAGTLFSVSLNAGTTGKTIKYVDGALPAPESGKVYTLSVLVAGSIAIASARIAS